MKQGTERKLRIHYPWNQIKDTAEHAAALVMGIEDTNRVVSISEIVYCGGT
jgi:hypothetical protein